MAGHDDSKPEIGWEMLDKTKFLPLCFLSSFCLKIFVYPLFVIKTRLQIQKQNVIYNDLRDAAFKILKSEGSTGLYRGFWINCLHVPASIVYITVNEGSRQVFTSSGFPDWMKSLASGGMASLANQSLVVPIEVVSQHLSILGLLHNASKNSLTGVLNISIDPSHSKFETAMNVIRTIYIADGIKGFYRGFVVSLLANVPQSALWWYFYNFYQEQLTQWLPEESVPRVAVQFLCGTLCGSTSTLLTNPLDVIRARHQVYSRQKFKQTIKTLWREDRMWFATKGLSVRLIQSMIISSFVIVGYEMIKRLSLKEQYKDSVRW